MLIRTWLVGLAALVLAAAPGHARGEYVSYSVTNLGDLPGGVDKSAATALNDHGQVVGYSEGPDGLRAFLWENGVITDLGVLNDTHHYSLARDINNSGQAVGRSAISAGGTVSSDLRPVIFSEGTVTDLGSFGGDYGFAEGINNAGQVVGLSRYSNGVTHAFLWSDGAVIDLAPSGGYSCAYGINDLGQIVGNMALEGRGCGFLWEEGSLTDLGDLPGGPEKTHAYAINNSGQVVGESAVSPTTVGHAFLWENGAMTDLGVLPDGSESSYARGINESGLVVGTSYSSSSMRAFVWDDVDGMKDLNTMLDSSGEGWTLCVATDINESGQIVGWGVDPSGSIRAFLLTPVPAPSTVVGLISIGFMGALGYVWRRRRRR